MADQGLVRGKDGLEIYVMCEIPNNVIQIDAFSKHFDGFSIGSNDLTQLTLGVDRDSAIVAFDYDERDEGVKEMIRLAVEGCKRNHRHSGLCGQAPSDYPEMAAVPGRARHRFHEPQSGCGAQDDAERTRGRKAARPQRPCMTSIRAEKQPARSTRSHVGF